MINLSSVPAIFSSMVSGVVKGITQAVQERSRRSVTVPRVDGVTLSFVNECTGISPSELVRSLQATGKRQGENSRRSAIGLEAEKAAEPVEAQAKPRKNGYSALPFERRSELARKGWETRRRRLAAGKSK